MSPRLLLFGVVLLAGCGARSQLLCPVAIVHDDIVDAPLIDATVVHDVAPDTGLCSVPLHVDSIDVPFGCIIDLRVGHDATLGFPCEGGAASATFPSGTFTGTVSGGAVNLALATRFEPGDGCVWVTHQTITGSLGSGMLAYSYTEAPAPGETGCLPPCPVSRAVIATQPSPPRDDPPDVIATPRANPCP